MAIAWAVWPSSRSFGWRLSNDGTFLANLEGYGVDIRKGGRADFLARTLRPACARVDQNTLQIVATIDRALQPTDILALLAALSRAQDIGYWTKERIRSTFKEDATLALAQALNGAADLQPHICDRCQPGRIPGRPPDPAPRHSQQDAVTAVFWSRPWMDCRKLSC